MTSTTTPLDERAGAPAARAMLRRLPALSTGGSHPRQEQAAVPGAEGERGPGYGPSTDSSVVPSAKGSVPIGPKPCPEAGLEQRNGAQVGPRGAVQDRGDRRRIDAAYSSNGAGGKVAHLFAKSKSEQSRGLSWHVVDGGDGPVVGEGDRVRPGVARHDGIVGPTTARGAAAEGAAPRPRLALLRGGGAADLDNSDTPLDAGSTHQRSEALVSQFIGAHGSEIAADHWPAIEEFVCAVITDMHFDRTHDAKNYFTAVTRLVHWACFEAGLDLDREIIFHPETIATFISQGCDDLKPSSRGSYRSRALQVTDRFFPGLRGDVRNQSLAASTMLPCRTARRRSSSFATGRATRARSTAR